MYRMGTEPCYKAFLLPKHCLEIRSKYLKMQVQIILFSQIVQHFSAFHYEKNLTVTEI